MDDAKTKAPLFGELIPVPHGKSIEGHRLHRAPYERQIIARPQDLRICVSVAAKHLPLVSDVAADL